MAEFDTKLAESEINFGSGSEDGSAGADRDWTVEEEVKAKRK